MKTCDQCRKPLRGKGNQTYTRTLCDVCFAQYRGTVGGYLGSGNLGTALYTGSLFKRRAEEEAKKKRR